MANYWITKRAALEALKLSEGLPQHTMINVECHSEVKDDKEYTVFTLSVNGKQKTIKDEFKKLLLKNGAE